MNEYIHLNTPTFSFKTEPLAHQAKTFYESRDLEYYAVLWEMGCGKTKLVIDTIAWLYGNGKIDSVLVVAPKGAYRVWVDFEIDKHLDLEKYKVRRGVWSASWKVQDKKEAMALMNKVPGRLDIMCMNIEGFSTVNPCKFAYQFVKAHSSTLLVVDESSAIKNPKAQRTKNLVKLGKFCSYRRIMTGTPMPQSPLDFYSQFDLLKDGLLGFQSWFQFRHYYAQYETIRLGTRSFQKIVGYRNVKELEQKVAKFSSRVTKEECLDLPEKIYTIREVELTPDQLRMYEEMKSTMVTEFESSLVTVNSALTAIMKLQQIICGHVNDENGETIDIPNGRIVALQEVLQEIAGKVIIWCAFRRDVQLIRLALPKEQTVTYYGETTQTDRIEAVRRFNDDKDCRFFVGTPGAGGKGLTLISAADVIYYSNSYNLEHRLQSEDRAHRIGQTRNVNYVDLVARKTVDERIIKALKAKKNLAQSILDDWRTLIS